MALDNKDLERLMNVLEEMEDEDLAVLLLSELNRKTAALGKLIRNLDPSLSTVEWKKKCDQAQAEIDEVVRKINQQG